MWCSSLAQCHGGKRLCQPCVLYCPLAISLVYSSRFQTNDLGLWSGNETSCVHVYKIRKWHPKQRTAASECCEWLLTKVNLKLWRRRVVVELRAEISISFVQKWRWALKPFLRYHCWTSWSWQERKKERKKEYEKWHVYIFVFSCLLRGFWPLIWVLLITKALKEEAWALR